MAPPESSAASRARRVAHQAFLDAVAVQQGAPAPRVQRGDIVEIRAGQVAVGPRAPDEDRRGPLPSTARRRTPPRSVAPGCPAVAAAVACGRGCPRSRNAGAPRSPPARRASAGTPFPCGTRRSAVPGATDPLQERRDRARRADLDHQVHVADVDAELERGGGHERPQSSRPSAAARRPGAAPSTGCRDDWSRRPRRAGASAAPRFARPSCAC